MTINKYKKYLKKEYPVAYASVGRFINNPEIAIEKIIKNIQWNYQYGKIEWNDMLSESNEIYNEIFTLLLENDLDTFFSLIDDFLLSIRISYDDSKGTFDKEIIKNIFLNNKNEYKYYTLSLYTLIAGNYDFIYNLLKEEYRPIKFLNMNIRKVLKLFNSIITNEFADSLIKEVKKNREKPESTYNVLDSITLSPTQPD
ncbi:MAG: hypothetical protein ACRC4L_03120 [Mycoplasma sp.]